MLNNTDNQQLRLIESFILGCAITILFLPSHIWEGIAHLNKHTLYSYAGVCLFQLGVYYSELQPNESALKDADAPLANQCITDISRTVIDNITFTVITGLLTAIPMIKRPAILISLCIYLTINKRMIGIIPDLPHFFITSSSQLREHWDFVIAHSKEINYMNELQTLSNRFS